MSLRAWVRPASYLRPGQAFLLGTLAWVITALSASWGGLVMDGVLDLHFLSLSPLAGDTSPRWLANLAQGLANGLWACLSLGVAARLITHDVQWSALFAHQWLARWPMMIASTYLAVPAIGDTLQALTFEMIQALPTAPNQVMAEAQYLWPALQLTLLSIPILVTTIGMVWLMFDGYRQAISASKTATVVSFIVALIVASVLSKLTLF